VLGAVSSQERMPDHLLMTLRWIAFESINRSGFGRSERDPVLCVLLKRAKELLAVLHSVIVEFVALARAQRKSERSAIPIRFDQGFADELPYPEASFDHVFSTFMFHHLLADKREKTLCEVRRVLAPGGSFHLLDFTPPEANRLGLLTRYFHSSEQLKDNSVDRILSLMNQAGFVSCEKVREGTMLFGILRFAYYQGRGA
jgi:SAM-dependent methyltransferase